MSAHLGRQTPGFFTALLLSLCLGLPSSFAETVSNPIHLSINRVDSNGKIAAIPLLRPAEWSMQNEMCAQTEFVDPNQPTPPSTWKTLRPENIHLKTTEKSVQICVRNFLSSFSVITPSSQAEIHYLIEIAPAQTNVITSPTCSSQNVNLQSKFEPFFFGVGIDCSVLENGDQALTLYTPIVKGKKLKLRVKDTSYTAGQDAIPISSDETGTKIEILNESGKSYGFIQAKSLVSPPPVSAKRVAIPLEASLGVLHQSKTVNFGSSPFNESHSSAAIDVKAFRRDLLPIQFPFIGDDLFYFAKLQVSFLPQDQRTFEGIAGLLKPFSVLNGVNTYAGLGVQAMQDIEGIYGVSLLLAPSINLQAESPDLKYDGRVDFSTLGSKLIKLDLEASYSLPWSSIQGSFVTANYSHLSVPKSDQGAKYDFTDNRFGIQIGYRFGGTP